MNHSKQRKQYNSNFAKNRLFLLPLSWHCFQIVWGFFPSYLPKNSFSQRVSLTYWSTTRKKPKNHWANCKHKGKFQKVDIKPLLNFHDFHSLILEIISCILTKPSAVGRHWPNARYPWKPLTHSPLQPGRDKKKKVNLWI